MKTIKLTIISVMSVFLLQACGSSDKNNTQPNPSNSVPVPVERTSIVDAAVSNGGFTTLVAALQATGLDAALDDISNTYTVFAPTDAAFALLGDDTINALLADTDTLTNILTYHVIEGEVDAATAISLAGSTVNMLNTNALALSLDGDNLLVNTSTVIMTDIQTDNGIIHVIDAVLMPPAMNMEPTSNIVETAIAAGNFTTLVATLQATSLDAVLSDENANFTVFAPTDAAFALIDASTISALLNDTDALSSILLQHVVSGAVDSVSAYSLNGQMVETASMAKLPLNINSSTDTLMFGGADIVTKDIYTSNGVIHVIDAVILGDTELPATANTLVDVAASQPMFSTLVSALQSTGLDSVLAGMDSNYTVIAPTNDAFAKLPEGLLESLTAEQLSNILLYHVLPGSIASDAAISVAKSSMNMATTANMSNVALSFVDQKLFVNGSQVKSSDIIASNGLIHVVDNVLLPTAMMDEPTQNIVEVALSDPDTFSTLVTALTAADLVTTLSDESATFTVFAPTNDAFAKVDPDALNALLADTTALTNVLLSHVVADSAITQLDAFAANGKMLTTASGSMVDVMVDSETGMLMIGGSHVVISDIHTTNGIIHVIDTVILD